MMLLYSDEDFFELHCSATKW